MTRSDLWLCAFGNIASYRLQRLLAKRAAARGHSIGFLYWGSDESALDEVRKGAGSLGEVASLSQFPENACQSLPVHRFRNSARLLPLFTAVLRSPERERFRAFKQLHAGALNQAAAAILHFAPTGMIVSEDGISSNLAVLTAARQLGLPVIDVPFGYGARQDLELSIEEKANKGELLRAEGTAGRLLRLFAPQWIKTGKFSGAVMFPPEYILAGESLGISVRDAWTVHGGGSDCFCVESEAALRHYEKEGIPHRRRVLTGSPYCDEMLDAVSGNAAARAALRQATRIDPRQLRVLVSWPPDYHSHRGSFSEFATYNEMTLVAIRFLASLPNVALTVSLHPAVSRETRALLQANNIAVSDDYVIRLIPLHDVFVTYFSSTIRWAIAAGKPVVNFDAYGLNLDIYDDAGGFTNAGKFAKFKSIMTELSMSSDAFQSLAQLQRESASHWGLLDGDCSARIFDVMDAVGSHGSGLASPSHDLRWSNPQRSNCVL